MGLYAELLAKQLMQGPFEETTVVSENGKETTLKFKVDFNVKMKLLTVEVIQGPNTGAMFRTRLSQDKEPTVFIGDSAMSFIDTVEDYVMGHVPIDDVNNWTVEDARY